MLTLADHHFPGVLLLPFPDMGKEHSPKPVSTLQSPLPPQGTSEQTSFPTTLAFTSRMDKR